MKVDFRPELFLGRKTVEGNNMTLSQVWEMMKDGQRARSQGLSKVCKESIVQETFEVVKGGPFSRVFVDLVPMVYAVATDWIIVKEHTTLVADECRIVSMSDQKLMCDRSSVQLNIRATFTDINVDKVFHSGPVKLTIEYDR